MTRGVGWGAFDKAYSDENWVVIDAFKAGRSPVLVEYRLYKENVRSPNPKAAVVCFDTEDDNVNWQTVNSGRLATIKEQFGRMKDTLGTKVDFCPAEEPTQPEAPATDYTALPNFGRF